MLLVCFNANPPCSSMFFRMYRHRPLQDLEATLHSRLEPYLPSFAHLELGLQNGIEVMMVLRSSQDNKIVTVH